MQNCASYVLRTTTPKCQVPPTAATGRLWNPACPSRDESNTWSEPPCSANRWFISTCSMNRNHAISHHGQIAPWSHGRVMFRFGHYTSCNLACVSTTPGNQATPHITRGPILKKSGLPPSPRLHKQSFQCTQYAHFNDCTNRR
jgi:hypothetical protein